MLSFVKRSPMNDQWAVCALYGTDCVLSTFVGINKRYEDKNLRSHSLFSAFFKYSSLVWFGKKTCKEIVT